MPLIYQHIVSENTKLAIWKIEEAEEFFLKKVPPPATSNLHKRLQHLAGRWLLQSLFPDFPYHEIIIADTRKPYLPNEQYHFSISHCREYAAAIVSKNKRVGVDVEITTEKVARIKHKFLHIDDLATLSEQLAESSKHPSTNYQLLTLLWCAKEAVFKWWSYGGVDFSEHIRLQPFTLFNEGIIPAYFLKNQKKIHLQLNYKLFGELCLVWVVE